MEPDTLKTDIESPESRHVEELLFDKDNPHWTVPTALAYWILSILAIVSFQVVLGLIYASYQGISLKESIDDPSAILVQIIAVLPAHILTLLVGWMIVTRFGRYSFGRMLGTEWGGFRFWHAALIMSGMMGLFALFLWIFGDKENELDRVLASSRAAVYAVAVMATFSAPIVEEVIYRGVLYSAFQRRLNTTYAVIMVTILFAAVHLPQYWGDFATILALLTLSLVLTLVRVITGNLLPCVVLHFVFNGIQTALLVAEPWIEPVSDLQN